MPEPLIGEPLALDLLNTRTYDGDLIATPRALGAWLALEADRLDVGIHVPTVADVAAVHAVRRHAATAIDRARRGERPAAAALDELTAAQRAAPAIRELRWDGAAVIAEPRRRGTSAARLAAELAEAVAVLLADPAIRSVRECEAPDCVMLFLPAHPRRRWCSATRCGNRMRVARYYERHKNT